MNKDQLKVILSTGYDPASWHQVLTKIFGVRTVHQNPIQLPVTNDRLAESAWELGSFKTSDKQLVGVYQVDLTDRPRIWQNRVGLRSLLRSVYTNDVDAALVVFVQGDKWRLSLISEIKVWDAKNNEILDQKTEPKRYTYLLGIGEQTLTATKRLSQLSGKEFDLDTLVDTFGVESLNKEFYSKISRRFFDLVGGTTGAGANRKVYKRSMALPGMTGDAEEIKKRYQEFAVRLIGRIVFCWFLKVKHSELGKTLLPDTLLSSKAARETKNFYHAVLEPLFFQCLNTPMSERIADLPDGCEDVPFLNGGLFEAHNEDFYNQHSFTGNYANYALKIPDQWFLGLLGDLEEYNFTLDENSTVDIEISIDPEMLGRIFENLLAEINPDSGETARKETGSYYTPREIVDHMVNQSLCHFLAGRTGISKKKLIELFKIDSKPDFDEEQINKLLDALNSFKALDPACGSGAFPLGILHSIILALEKLDKDASLWKKRQLDQLENPVLRKQLKTKLSSASIEYARKIGVIQNAIYGVDIQPIGVEISKLRCFLTLIVDEKIDESAPNRGIEPLPNLEFKFVAADSLRVLPQKGLYDDDSALGKLKEIRNGYLQSCGNEKAELRTEFLDLQDSIFDRQTANYESQKDNRALTLSLWKPFDFGVTAWFDPEWMFGIGRFDLVIGNPPYIKEYTRRAAFDHIRNEKYYQGKMDIWYFFACHFLERFVQNDSGLLTFIATNNWVTNAGASKLRKFIADNTTIISLTDFGDTKIFESAGIQTMILISQRRKDGPTFEFDYAKVVSSDARRVDAIDLVNGVESKMFLRSRPMFDRKERRESIFTFSLSSVDGLLDRIKKSANFTLNARTEVATGIDVHQDFLNRAGAAKLGDEFRVGQGIFNISETERKRLDLSAKEEKLIRPFYTTDELHRYYGDSENKLWVIYTDSSFKHESAMRPYPNLKRHLDQFEKVITSDNAPYGLHRARNEYFFVDEKIISLRKCERPTFTYTDFDCYVSQTFFVIKTNRVNQKYLTAVLNSKVIAFWLKHCGKMQGFNYQVDKEPLLALPLKTIPDTSIFVILVDYIIHLSSVELQNSSTKLMTSFFDLVVNAAVSELYFPNEIRAANKDVLEHLGGLPPIAESAPGRRLAAIRAQFERLYDPNHPVRFAVETQDSIEEIRMINEGLS